MALKGKHILLGVTGGVAAYKAAELTRALREDGAEVRVVMTEAARQFVGGATLQALSGFPVASAWTDSGGDGMPHIHLARWADVAVVAPLSANTLAKLAHGTTDNLLTAVCLSDTPLLVAPAMNREMWEHAAVRENMATLRARGVRVCGPASGEQACGENGPGRMTEPQEIVAAMQEMAGENVSGCAKHARRARHPRPERQAAGELRILITAGPTHEAIDAVRYIGNRSSGRMGFALATAASQHARVTLIAGPVALPTPAGVKRVDVTSAEEMHAAVMARVADMADTDIFISCAAVADYCCVSPSASKLKKEDAEALRLELMRTPDILRAVTALDKRPFCVGFAAETENLAANAKAKLLAKNLDMIVANRVGAGAAYGFDSEDNEVDVYWRTGGKHMGPLPKIVLAECLMDDIVRCHAAKVAQRAQRETA